MKSVKSKKLTSSSIVFTGECVLAGLLIGTDGVNDPTITVYDGVDNTGTEIIPTTDYDSSALGLNGVAMGFAIECSTGIYVEITTGGSVEVVTYYKQRSLWGVF